MFFVEQFNFAVMLNCFFSVNRINGNAKSELIILLKVFRFVDNLKIADLQEVKTKQK